MGPVECTALGPRPRKKRVPYASPRSYLYETVKKRKNWDGEKRRNTHALVEGSRKEEGYKAVVSTGVIPPPGDM